MHIWYAINAVLQWGVGILQIWPVCEELSPVRSGGQACSRHVHEEETHWKLGHWGSSLEPGHKEGAQKHVTELCSVQAATDLGHAAAPTWWPDSLTPNRGPSCNLDETSDFLSAPASWRCWTHELTQLGVISLSWQHQINEFMVPCVSATANKAEEIAQQHFPWGGGGGGGQGRGPEHGQTSRGACVDSWRRVPVLCFFGFQTRKSLSLKECLQARFCSLPSQQWWLHFVPSCTRFKADLKLQGRLSCWNTAKEMEQENAMRGELADGQKIG